MTIEQNAFTLFSQFNNCFSGTPDSAVRELMTLSFVTACAALGVDPYTAACAVSPDAALLPDMVRQQQEDT